MGWFRSVGRRFWSWTSRTLLTPKEPLVVEDKRLSEAEQEAGERTRLLLVATEWWPSKGGVSALSHAPTKVLVINGRWRVTAEHPVAAGGLWKRASDLHLGDHVHTKHGQVEVDSLAMAAQPIEVFDLSVGEPHTFFADELLVHNKSIEEGEREFVYDGLRKPTPPAPRLDAEARRAWIEAQARPLAACMAHLGLTMMKAGVRLPLDAPRELVITEVRDRDGLPVDQRGSTERARFRTCMAGVLDVQRMPGKPPRLEGAVRAQLTVTSKPERAEWKELRVLQSGEF